MTDGQPFEQNAPERSRGKTAGTRGGSESSHARSKDWTIKRLPPETIEVSRDAARRSGMKINAWVGKALEQAATALEATHEKELLADPDKMLKLERSILEEIAQLRAQNADLVQTVNSMSAILLKMYTAKNQKD